MEVNISGNCVANFFRLLGSLFTMLGGFVTSVAAGIAFYNSF